MSTGAATLTESGLEAWGRAIGASAPTPVFLALDGPLGAGKSVLARAVARGAGVRGAVPSPTYNLVLAYDPSPGRRVVHMDLYRLDGPDEVLELGWDDLLADPRAVIVVEWAERAGAHLPRDRWSVRLAPVAGRPELRRVEWQTVGRPAPLPAPDAALSGSRPE